MQEEVIATQSHSFLTLRWASVESFVCVVLFVACMSYVYVSWLVPVYYVYGFAISPGDHPALWFSMPIVLLTAILLPMRLDKFSDYFLWMVFYFVFVPAMIFVPLQGTLPNDGLALVFALGISFNSMRFLSRYEVKLPSVRVSRSALIVAFACSYVALAGYTASVYGGSLRLADLASVYEQRAISGELATGSLVGYATGFLSGAFNPFLMAYGLVRRRRVWFAIGAVGQLFVYSTSALKSVVLTPVLLLVFYWFLIRREEVTASRFGLLILASCLVPLMLLLLLDLADEGLVTQLVALVFMRTYGITGALTGAYAGFFETHPHTIFSHISIVSLFVRYPFEQSLGQEVGYSLVGRPLDANANFFATDGIASAGNLGVVLVGVIVGLFLTIANGTIDPRNRRLAFTALIPFIVMACNTSIFTALLSGGGGLVLLMIYVSRPADLRALPRGA